MPHESTKRIWAYETDCSLKRFCTQDFCRKYNLCCESYVNLFLELWSVSGFLLSYALLLCISTTRKNMLKGTPLYSHTIFIVYICMVSVQFTVCVEAQEAT